MAVVHDEEGVTEKEGNVSISELEAAGSDDSGIGSGSFQVDDHISPSPDPSHVPCQPSIPDEDAMSIKPVALEDAVSDDLQAIPCQPAVVSSEPVKPIEEPDLGRGTASCLDTEVKKLGVENESQKLNVPKVCIKVNETPNIDLCFSVLWENFKSNNIPLDKAAAQPKGKDEKAVLTLKASAKSLCLEILKKNLVRLKPSDEEATTQDYNVQLFDWKSAIHDSQDISAQPRNQPQNDLAGSHGMLRSEPNWTVSTEKTQECESRGQQENCHTTSVQDSGKTCVPDTAADIQLQSSVVGEASKRSKSTMPVWMLFEDKGRWKSTVFCLILAVIRYLISAYLQPMSMNGPTELSDMMLEKVRQWHYANKAGHLTTALAVWNNPSHLEMCLPKDDAHADILADYKPADWFSMRGDVDTIITRCFPARGSQTAAVAVWQDALPDLRQLELIDGTHGDLADGEMMKGFQSLGEAASDYDDESPAQTSILSVVPVRHSLIPDSRGAELFFPYHGGNEGLILSVHDGGFKQVFSSYQVERNRYDYRKSISADVAVKKMALRIDRQKEWEADEKGSVVIDGPNSTKGLLAAENLPLLFQTKTLQYRRCQRTDENTYTALGRWWETAIEPPPLSIVDWKSWETAVSTESGLMNEKHGSSTHIIEPGESRTRHEDTYSQGAPSLGEMVVLPFKSKTVHTSGYGAKFEVFLPKKELMKKSKSSVHATSQTGNTLSYQRINNFALAPSGERSLRLWNLMGYNSGWKSSQKQWLVFLLGTKLSVTRRPGSPNYDHTETERGAKLSRISQSCTDCDYKQTDLLIHTDTDTLDNFLNNADPPKAPDTENFEVKEIDVVYTQSPHRHHNVHNFELRSRDKKPGDGGKSLEMLVPLLWIVLARIFFKYPETLLICSCIVAYCGTAEHYAIHFRHQHSPHAIVQLVMMKLGTPKSKDDDYDYESVVRLLTGWRPHASQIIQVYATTYHGRGTRPSTPNQRNDPVQHHHQAPAPAFQPPPAPLQNQPHVTHTHHHDPGDSLQLPIWSSLTDAIAHHVPTVDGNAPNAQANPRRGPATVKSTGVRPPNQRLER